VPLTNERRQIAHLLRRAGFGGSPDEIDTYARLGFKGAVTRLVDYEQVSNATLDARVAQLEAELDLTKLPSIQTIWLERMLSTARPLEEKMTLFWHDHFATANSKVGRPELMYDQNRFFRAHALDGYKDMLQGISRNPAMIRWLDGNSNRKAHPNENYARELMELFTLGVGNYSEIDVREGARAFTGWFLDKEYQFTFNARQHDTGTKTLLGKTGKWDGDDVLNIILAQPAAAEHLSRKLFIFLVHDHPSQATIGQLSETFRGSGYKVRELVRAILLHPEFLSDDAYHGVIRSPAEYLIGSMKSLGVEEFLPGAQGMLNRMGMNLYNPPNVSGWAWGTDWIGTNTYVERINAAMMLTTQRGDNAAKGVGPEGLAKQLGAGTPEEVVDRLLDVLVDGDVDPVIREGLLDFARPGYRPGNRDWLDRAVRGTTHLIMATPIYQMA
jgi:uncharacterized protein (DUF1800 family)